LALIWADAVDEMAKMARKRSGNCFMFFD